MIKVLKFRQCLIESILNRTKTTTFRLFDDKNISVDDVISLVNWETGKEFAKARVIAIKEKKMNDLNEADFEGHEKYVSKEEMFKKFSEFHNKEIAKENVVKIISFKLVPVI